MAVMILMFFWLSQHADWLAKANILEKHAVSTVRTSALKIVTARWLLPTSPHGDLPKTSSLELTAMRL
jgi:hypothetical protein